MLRKRARGLLLAAACAFAPPSHAELIDRGNGMLYDTVLNVTWLQDASYARTSGYDEDGRMDWSQALTWADNLVYGGYDDWRLPRTAPVNGTTWIYEYSTDASTDVSYNIRSTQSELSYMYYENLGLRALCNPAGDCNQPDFGVNGNGTWGGEADVGLVRNLQGFTYWTGTVYALIPKNTTLWTFSTEEGVQNGYDMAERFVPWAVRDGDVAPLTVPALPPAGIAALAAALALLALRMTGRHGMPARRPGSAARPPRQRQQ